GRVPAAAIIGTVAGLLAWLIIAPLIVAIIIGAIGFLFTLLGGSRGWYGGPAGYSSGGFSGGGFSGGGGGFGGGGASGRW
ncbi:MAG: TPM domain-containing protein, partial [Burkholderiales bacterium]